MRILICGGRNWGNKAFVERLLEVAYAVEDSLTVVHTGARGAAAIANAWTIAERARGKEVETAAFKVEAVRIDLTPERMARAIEKRCRELFLVGKPQLVYWFPADPTEVRTDEDLVEEAKRQGIAVRRFVWSERLRTKRLTRADGCYDDGLCGECGSRVRSKKPGGRCKECGYGGGDRKTVGGLGCMPPRCKECEAMDSKPGRRR